MHAFPNVAEVDRYITERLLIAGSDQPSIFTPDAVDLIYRCSEGIPRNINNLCDNAMIAAYSEGVQMIGRKIIEEVADNLDMLPRKDLLAVAEAKLDIPASRVLNQQAEEEVFESHVFRETVRPRVFDESNGYPDYANNNGRSNGNGRHYEINDDEITLEIDGFTTSFRKF
jgi:hypothetical protein